ncbi:MAG: Uncharacterised protein [Porticoccaceae bacterium UBA1117]|nr:MAG: Uncharacterised protein [Porticoccaceae bacterium UBA1117]
MSIVTVTMPCSSFSYLKTPIIKTFYKVVDWSAKMNLNALDQARNSHPATYAEREHGAL